MSKNKSQEKKKGEVRAEAPVHVQLPLRPITDQDPAFVETKEMQEGFFTGVPAVYVVQQDDGKLV